MLAALDAEPGMTVCEIGTGTGYNAALLAHRLGAENVTTIEVDAELASRASAVLADAGYRDVTVVTGDGVPGYPPRAPYDRVLSTAAVQHLPYAWVAQTRPGGRVVTPWGTAYLNGALLSLTVGDDGTATGRLVDNVAFMWLRDQRLPLTQCRLLKGATSGCRGARCIRTAWGCLTRWSAAMVDARVLGVSCRRSWPGRR
jgi:protein-L-isoaspartate(D-aspartate) O-methyltransferase